MEAERVAYAGVDEAAVVARVTRYSSLRGVERALLPSVRSRVQLPTTALGADLLGRLQSLLEHVRHADTASPEARARAGEELVRIDEALSSFSAALTARIEETPIAQLRATLPGIVDRWRGEVASLLDLCLESFVPRTDGPAPCRIDFLVTLLARQRVGDVSTLRCDPCTVSPGLRRRCTDDADDERAAALARRFREARIELLSTDAVDGVVEGMRAVKSELGGCLFDKDVLRELVSYNIAADNRFRELFELEQSRDAAIERTLRALAALDLAAPGGAGGPDACGPDSLPGVRALEDALAARPGGLGRDDLADALTRAAVLVGLALRDLPSLIERLRALDVDVSRMKTDWVGELDGALQTAITALAKSGRNEQAARLARTRMRYLSIH